MMTKDRAFENRGVSRVPMALRGITFIVVSQMVRGKSILNERGYCIFKRPYSMFLQRRRTFKKIIIFPERYETCLNFKVT